MCPFLGDADSVFGISLSFTSNGISPPVTQYYDFDFFQLVEPGTIDELHALGMQFILVVSQDNLPGYNYDEVTYDPNEEGGAGPASAKVGGFEPLTVSCYPNPTDSSL